MHETIHPHGASCRQYFESGDWVVKSLPAVLLCPMEQTSKVFLYTMPADFWDGS